MLTAMSSACAIAIPPWRTSTVRALTVVAPPCVIVTLSAVMVLARGSATLSVLTAAPSLMSARSVG